MTVDDPMFERHYHITNNLNWNEIMSSVERDSEGDSSTIWNTDSSENFAVISQIRPFIQTLFWTSHHNITRYGHITNNYKRNYALSSSQDVVPCHSQICTRKHGGCAASD